MQVFTSKYYAGKWEPPLQAAEQSCLTLVFGDKELYSEQLSFIQDSLRPPFIAGCSTGGEILGNEPLDESLVLINVSCDSARFKAKLVPLDGNLQKHCADALADLSSRLKHLLVFMDGLNANSANFLRQLHKTMPRGVTATGGLAGDYNRFEVCHVWLDERIESGHALLIGCYGEKLSIGVGCHGGWDTLGPRRTITRASEYVIYEIDDLPALQLYRRYLGPFVEQLPAVALQFPIQIKSPTNKGDTGIVRSVRGIDEDNQALILAGPVKQGLTAQFMRTHFNRLLDGAQTSAQQCFESGSSRPHFILACNCLGRRQIAPSRMDEELEIVCDRFPEASVIGFYSYGECAPTNETGRCFLHNQTLVLTSFGENE